MPGTVATVDTLAGLVCASAAIAGSERSHAAPTKKDNERGRRDDTFTAFPEGGGLPDGARSQRKGVQRRFTALRISFTVSATITSIPRPPSSALDRRGSPYTPLFCPSA